MGLVYVRYKMSNMVWILFFLLGGNSDPVHSFSLFFWPRNWWKTTTSSPLKCRSRRYGTCPSAGPFAGRSEQQNPTTGGCNGRCLSKRGGMELPKPKNKSQVRASWLWGRTTEVELVEFIAFFCMKSIDILVGPDRPWLRFKRSNDLW